MGFGAILYDLLQIRQGLTFWATPPGEFELRWSTAEYDNADPAL